MTATWPPNLARLKLDLKIEPEDTRDDDRLQQVLDAAVAKVAGEWRKGDFNFTADPVSTLPAPDADLELGTIRLAGRWHTRRRSPDGMIDMGEMGISRVSSFDVDIDRLLRIGRFQKARVG